MLSLRQITLARGHKKLLENASVSIYEKQKVGLVGQNGCGKSSLFAFLLGNLSAESGECSVSPNLRISHLSQQTPDSKERAIDFVLAGDCEHKALIERLDNAEKNGRDDEVLSCHELMAQTGGYSKPAQAASILAGLGFSTEEQQAEVNSFSGGWRMRLSLARCLMKPADLMLLDEPTNHLDMEAIFWLEKWLKQSPSSVIVISHDREFLDTFVSHILHVEQQTLTIYSGNYSIFEKTRAQKLALQQAQYEKQQAKINHMMAYVQRFRAKASKAKQAQSRLNAITKMELVAQAQIDSPFSFEFFPSERVGKPIINCDQVSAGYDPEKPILQRLNFSLNPGDRIALLGPNGEGKSTLIKTLTSLLPVLKGEIRTTAHLKIGYYAQHQLEQLNPNLSPVETIQEITPNAREQIIRDYLGGFNFLGDMAVNPIHHFSGGEKARLALAKLVWEKPNLLLLDEPTNHLDLGMRAAIEIALQSYEGAMVLISHDRHLLRSVVDEFYLVYQGKVQPFAGDLEDYHQWLQHKNPPTKMQSSGTQSTPSDRIRERRSLQNKLKKLEQLNERLQEKKLHIEQQLADPTIYETQAFLQYTALVKERDELHHNLIKTEEEWLSVLHELDSYS
jgi:ATP-binding cassette subfamily F protein 3